LGDVLHREFGVRVNKRMQRANWGQRPLPDKLLNYARLDTHYLIELRDRLAQELKEKGRWEEAREECERISHLEQTNEEDPDKFWKITNARRLNPVQAAVLRELYYFREEQAEGLDRPTFKVIGDKTLLAIAQKMPRTPEALGRLHGMSAGQVQRFGKGLLEAVARGKNSPPPEPPQAEKVDDNVHNRYKKLRNWRKKKAQARQVESDIILPRDLVWEIARQPPRNLETLQELMQPLEWRFQRYGEEILQLIQK
jgi:ribonuclease D